MKLKTTIITGLATLAFLTFAAGSLQAQVTCAITITTTASAQNGSTDNGTTNTTLAPIKVSIDTKQILAAMALAENAAGNYPAGTSFPTGAKLVVVISNNNAPDFQVLDKTNHLLVDVSDILFGLNSGNNGSDIFSGKQTDATGLSSPTTTDLQIFTLAYDDTAILGSDKIKLYLTGLAINTTTDTVPNKLTGVYTETQSHKMANAAGDGSQDGLAFVLTGSVAVTGKASFVH